MLTRDGPASAALPALYSLQIKADVEVSNAIAIGRIKARVDADKALGVSKS
jgi:hypothetical protein